MRFSDTVLLKVVNSLSQGVPLNDSSNLRLGIAELSQAVLGDRLRGLQVGNEPDLYIDHKHRIEVRVLLTFVLE